MHFKGEYKKHYDHHIVFLAQELSKTWCKTHGIKGNASSNLNKGKSRLDRKMLSNSTFLLIFF